MLIRTESTPYGTHSQRDVAWRRAVGCGAYPRILWRVGGWPRRLIALVWASVRNVIGAASVDPDLLRVGRRLHPVGVRDATRLDCRDHLGRLGLGLVRQTSVRQPHPGGCAPRPYVRVGVELGGMIQGAGLQPDVVLVRFSW